MKKLLLSSALALAASSALAQDGIPLELPSVPPMPATDSVPMLLVPVPLPNDGVAVLGQYGNLGGMATYQPLPGDHTGIGVVGGDSHRNTLGVGVLLDPSNTPIGGNVSIGIGF